MVGAVLMESTGLIVSAPLDLKVSSAMRKQMSATLIHVNMEPHVMMNLDITGVIAIQVTQVRTARQTSMSVYPTLVQMVIVWTR